MRASPREPAAGASAVLYPGDDTSKSEPREIISDPLDYKERGDKRGAHSSLTTAKPNETK